MFNLRLQVQRDMQWELMLLLLMLLLLLLSSLLLNEQISK